MRIEIYGGTLSNFGDELMLRRILGELDSRIEGFIPAIYPRDMRYALRARLGLFQLLPGYGRGPVATRMAVRVAEAAGGRRIRALPEQYGLVPPGSIDGVVTLSGFAFSDAWGSAATRAATVFEGYAKRKRPIILLPQALGPFENPTVRSAFRRIVRTSALVYARDETSYQYALSACPADSRIRRAYDITLVEPLRLPAPRDLTVSIVPNQRMLDRGPPSWRKRYVGVMRSIVHSLSEANAKIDVLVHGREAEDVALATQLAANVPHAQMLSFRDPTQVRRRLAESSVVVSSRYHALVGAMAHGVPALGIGWTHKYQGLFNDFGLPQLCVGQQESSAAILDKLQRICSSAENVTVRDTIGRKLPEIARMNSGMWDEVARTLTG